MDAVPADRLYTISQVDALVDVPRSTIRFWEKEFGEFLQPQRTNGHQRRFTLADVTTLKEIKRLVTEELYTLEGARRQLRKPKPSPSPDGANGQVGASA